jgi:bifunctional DNA-binding transcriptional regulator/antitoxin component of YhaV-PrlF toxin-antitoxin module
MRKEIIITTASETFAFGVTSDTYDQVYIPASLQKMFDLKQDDIVTAILRPNEGPKASQVPYFAIFIVDESADDDVLEDIEPPVVEPPKLNVKKEIADIFSDYDRVMTSNMVAELLTLRTKKEFIGSNISIYLNELHEKGVIAKAAVNQSPSEHRSVYALWAKRVSLFKELASEERDNG